MALYVVYLVDLGSSPGQVKPKIIKLVFIASLLSSTKEKRQRLVNNKIVINFTINNH
jgi:hypothetical protein